MLTLKTINSLIKGKNYNQETAWLTIYNDCMTILCKKGFVVKPSETEDINPFNLLNIVDYVDLLLDVNYICQACLPKEDDNYQSVQSITSWMTASDEIFETVFECFSNTAIQISMLYQTRLAGADSSMNQSSIIPISDQLMDHVVVGRTPASKVIRYSLLSYKTLFDQGYFPSSIMEKVMKGITILYDTNRLQFYFPKEKIGKRNLRDYHLHEFYQCLFEHGISPFPFLVSGILNDVPTQHQYRLEYYFTPENERTNLVPEERQKNYHWLDPSILFNFLNTYISKPDSNQYMDPVEPANVICYSGWVGETLRKFGLVTYRKATMNVGKISDGVKCIHVLISGMYHLLDLENQFQTTNDYRAVAFYPDKSTHVNKDGAYSRRALKSPVGVKRGIRGFEFDNFYKKKRLESISILLKILTTKIDNSNNEMPCPLHFGLLIYYFREYRMLLEDQLKNKDEATQIVSETLLVYALKTSVGIAGIIPYIIPIKDFWWSIFAGTNDGEVVDFKDPLTGDIAFFYHLENGLHYFDQSVKMEISKRKFILILTYTCGATIFTKEVSDITKKRMTGETVNDASVETYGQSNQTRWLEMRLLSDAYYSLCKWYKFDLLSQRHIHPIDHLPMTPDGILQSRFNDSPKFNVNPSKNPTINEIHWILAWERVSNGEVIQTVPFPTPKTEY